MKKIMIVGPMSSGHIQRWILPLIDKYDFEIVTLHSSNNVIDGVKVHNLYKLFNNRLDFFINIPYLLYLYMRIKPNLVHVHFLSSYGIMASFLSRKVKKILSIWGTDLNGKPTENRLMRFFANVAVSRYDIVNVPAYHMKDKLKKIFGFEAIDRVAVFQYGVEINKLPIKKYTNDPIIKFASVRNWDELYHIPEFIKSFAETKNDNFRLFIFGKGDERASIRINNLIREINDPRIVVMGFVRREELLEKLESMDVVVSVPDKDGAPLSLMESMFIGLYPLVSSIDANFEWLNENTATFISGYDRRQIIDAILQSSKRVRESETAHYIKVNRDKIINDGDYEKNIRKMDDIYITLLQ